MCWKLRPGEGTEVARECCHLAVTEAQSFWRDAIVCAARFHGARMPHATHGGWLDQIHAVVAQFICGDWRRRGVDDVSYLALSLLGCARRNFLSAAPRPLHETHLGQCLTGFSPRCYIRCCAEVAQLVEQPIRNRQVPGSSPGLGSRLSNTLLFNQFIFPFSGSAETLGTFGNTTPTTLSTARFCD